VTSRAQRAAFLQENARPGWRWRDRFAPLDPARDDWWWECLDCGRRGFMWTRADGSPVPSAWYVSCLMGHARCACGKVLTAAGLGVHARIHRNEEG
jgi:hypothetical protein